MSTAKIHMLDAQRAASYGPALIKPGRLMIRLANSIHLIPFQEIRRLQSDNNYCTVSLNNGREILVSKTLKTVARELPAKMFCRVPTY